jgi:NTP pyrophosphatase (non-canonical NTP hydrolase)
MTPNEYQELAVRTAPVEYKNLPKTMCYSESNILHAQLGIASESGELADAIKKHFIYGQELDYANIIEECGDLLWYIALLLEYTGSDMKDAMLTNIDKLKIRYPENFTEELAKERLDKQ